MSTESKLLVGQYGFVMMIFAIGFARPEEWQLLHSWSILWAVSLFSALAGCSYLAGVVRGRIQMRKEMDQ